MEKEFVERHTTEEVLDSIATRAANVYQTYTSITSGKIAPEIAISQMGNVFTIYRLASELKAKLDNKLGK